MEPYHYYFFTLKFFIIVALILVSLNFIKEEGPIFLIIDTLFKMSIGIFIIYYFSQRVSANSMDSHDRMLLMMSGVILLLTIDYKHTYQLIVGKLENKEKCEEKVHIITKPCPPCHLKDQIYGKINSPY
jgi:hypothetical protein